MLAKLPIPCLPAAAMGAEPFKAGYAAGRSLTSGQIIDLALGKPA